jgi:DNA-binding NarL/FixJ family response regulator
LQTIEPNAACLTGIRVLIVEDEPMLALCLRELLEYEECVVVGTPGTVSEALEATATASFDVAILDLNLHGLPVDSIAAAIVRGGRALVFSSGMDGSACAIEFQDWPMLHKPYPDEALFAALRTAVASSLSDLRPREAKRPA